MKNLSVSADCLAGNLPAVCAPVGLAQSLTAAGPIRIGNNAMRKTSMGIFRGVMVAALLCLAPSFAICQSQTDTTDWIRATLGSCGWPRQIHEEGSVYNEDAKEIIAVGNGKGMDFQWPNAPEGQPFMEELEYANIRSITYQSGTGNGVGRITFYGSVVASIDGVTVKTVKLPSVSFDLYDNAAMGPRLVKAFVHIAQLNGAKIVDNELF